tara:strand:- start:50 stop:235 length:186 start_codon:yes stop_codon:yes gene_type:complete
MKGRIKKCHAMTMGYLSKLRFKEEVKGLEKTAEEGRPKAPKKKCYLRRVMDDFCDAYSKGF